MTLEKDGGWVDFGGWLVGGWVVGWMGRVELRKTSCKNIYIQFVCLYKTNV